MKTPQCRPASRNPKVVSKARPRFEVLEDRCTPAVIWWDGEGEDGVWENPLNWEYDVVPGGAQDAKLTIRNLKEGKDYPLTTTTAKVPLSLVQPKSGRAIQFSPDGKLVAWVERGGKVFVCDYKAGKVVLELDASKYTSDVFFLPDGKRLITYGIFTIWDLTTGKKTFERQMSMRAVLPDGKHIVTRDQIVTRNKDDWVFMDLEGREKARFTYYPGQWQCHLLTFTPDQRLMIGAGSGGEIRVWNVPKLD